MAASGYLMPSTAQHAGRCIAELGAVAPYGGGGAPRLHALMLEMFPERGDTMKLDADPVCSNVRGFHVVGEVMNNSG